MRRAVVPLAVLLFLSVTPAFLAAAPERPSTDVRSILLQLREYSDDGRYAEAEAYYKSLSAAERRALDEAMANVTIETSSASGALPTPEAVVAPTDEVGATSLSGSASTLAAGCWWTADQVIGTTGGVLVWRYVEEIDWCGDGTWITWSSCEAYPGDALWGWTFDQHLAYCQITYGGTPWWNTVKYHSQGEFSWQWVEKYPWVDIQVDGGGNTWKWHG